MTTTPTIWKPRFTANHATAGEQLAPQAIGLANGNILVVWEDDTFGTGTGRDIVGRLYNPLGLPIGGQFQINVRVDAGDQTDPKIVALPGRGFVVAYTTQNDTVGTFIAVERFDSDRTSVGIRQITDTRDTLGDYAISVRANGDYIVAYELERAPGPSTDPEFSIDVYAQVFNFTSNNPGAEHKHTAQNWTDNDFLGDIAFFSNGDIISVSTEPDNASFPSLDSYRTAELRITSATGGQLGSHVEYAGSTDSDAFALDVAVLTGQRFVVVYGLGLSVTGQLAFKMGNRTTGGATVGTERIVTESYNFLEASVVALKDGGFLIAWIDGTIVRGTRFDALGSPIGQPGFTVSIGAAGGLGELSLTADGRVLVPFRNSSNEISAVILDPRNVNITGTVNPEVITAQTTSSVISASGGDDTLLGREGDDELYGGDGLDRLEGGNGNDLLDGGPLFDTLLGGFGNDRYYLRSVVTHGSALFVYDSVTESPGGGTDTVFVLPASHPVHGPIGGYTLPDNVEIGIVEGTAADLFSITGNALDNRLAGNAANNTLAGLGGFDRLEGGAGDDGYVLRDVNQITDPDGNVLMAYDEVVEAADGGHNDTVIVRRINGFGNPGLYVLPANVENGRIDGDDAFSLTGNPLGNRLTGNEGANTLRGLAGNDTLDGDDGADIASFTGPRANYELYTSTVGGVTGTLVHDQVGTDGFDYVTAIETLRFPSGDVTRFGAQQNLTANVDGARFDDVVYRKVSNGQVVFQNMTNGAPTGFDAITAPLSSAWKAIGAGDVTGDAKADVFIWNSSTGQVFSAAPGASGAPTYAVIASGIAGNFAAVGTGDIDGDGFTDLVVRDGGNGAITWRPMTGGSPDAFKPVGTFGPTWTYQGTGDVNRDGFADVAIRSAAGQVVLVNMANGAPSGFIDLGNVSGFRVGAIADLNADGFDDVVLQNEANGQVVWRDLSGVGASYKIATDPLGTSFLLRRGADVDNDGSADLIFQHATTGETIFRAMDNGVGTGWGTVSTPLGTDFLVV